MKRTAQRSIGAALLVVALLGAPLGAAAQVRTIDPNAAIDGDVTTAPPPVDDRTATDIAFAASVVVDDQGAIWLYYSLEDRRLARALIRRS